MRRKRKPQPAQRMKRCAKCGGLFRSKHAPEVLCVKCEGKPRHKGV